MGAHANSTGILQISGTLQRLLNMHRGRDYNAYIYLYHVHIICTCMCISTLKQESEPQSPLDWVAPNSLVFFRGFFSTLFLQPCHDLPYTMHNKKNLCCPAAEEMSLWFWRLREGAMNKAAEMSPVQGSAETNLYGGFRGDLIIKNAGRMRI